MGRKILKQDDLDLDISQFDLYKISRSTSRIPDLRSLKLSGDCAPVSMDIYEVYALSVNRSTSMFSCVKQGRGFLP